MPYRPSVRNSTRIYDANYNKGHSLYKSALDSIDARYALGARTAARESSLPRTRIDYGVDLGDGTLSDARYRAHRAITEETVFDSKGFRIPKAGVPLSSQIEKTFDAEIQSSMDRLRSNKLRTFEADIDMDVPKTSSFIRKARAEMNDSIYGLQNSSESSNFIKKRALKVASASSAVDSAIDSSNLTRWTKMSAGEDAESLAKKRALQSKARILELEDDMSTRQERQAARERKAVNLRKMIRDEFSMNDVEDDMKAITY